MAGTKYSNKKEVMGSYKKGGKVKKTGVYKLHKGEKVVTKKAVKKAVKKGKKFNAKAFEATKKKVFGMKK